MSSSAYGPDESFRSLLEHGNTTYLAAFMALATALTVFVLSYAYSRIIEHFPTGGGGYVVASKLLGEKAGLVSGSALLVDYVLTITVSIAAAGDALFSFVPPHWHFVKLPLDFAVLDISLHNADSSLSWFKMNKDIAKKNKASGERGIAALPVILLITGIIMEIVIAGGILAFSFLRGMPGWTISLSTMMP